MAECQGIIIVDAHGFYDLLKSVEGQGFRVTAEWELCLEVFKI